MGAPFMGPVGLKGPKGPKRDPRRLWGPSWALWRLWGPKGPKRGGETPEGCTGRRPGAGRGPQGGIRPPRRNLDPPPPNPT